jgi:hypothetical protein
MGVGTGVAVGVGVACAVAVGVAVGTGVGDVAGWNVPLQVPVRCTPLMVTVHGTLLIDIGVGDGAGVGVVTGAGRNVATHAAQLALELIVNAACCAPAATEVTSSRPMVPLAAVVFPRSVAATPLMVPADNVRGESYIPTPATASSPATTAAVDPLVAKVPLPVLHTEESNGEDAATPEYSAMSARIGPPDVDVTVTVVAPVCVLTTYHNEFTPSAAAEACFQAPLRLSETPVPDGVRNIPVRRCPLATAFGYARLKVLPVVDDADFTAP